jgi:hypothetical protein
MTERAVTNVNHESFKLHENAIDSTFGKTRGDACIKVLPPDLLSRLRDALYPSSSRIQDLLSEESPETPLLLSRHSEETVDRLSQTITPYEISSVELIAEIHEWINENFKEFALSPLSPVNTRAWSTHAKAQRFGPSAPHLDGFAPGHVKAMIYINGLSEESGALQIGNKIIINKPPGSVILFKNSDILHSAIPGKGADRLVVEVTLMRTFVFMPQLFRSHFNGRHLLDSAEVYRTNAAPEPLKRTSEYINIGSGLRNWQGWLLLDQIEAPKICKFTMEPQAILPAQTAGSKLVYSSHHIEHLCVPSLLRLISESRRVLREGAYLLLKYPDFEYFLEQLVIGNERAVVDKGIESVIWSWKNHGIEDCQITRTAMMFCGYWNVHYGDHFSRQISRDPRAYHGPPKAHKKELREVLLCGDIREASNRLNQIAMQDTEFSAFNHRTAWSHAWLVESVSSFGFQLVTKEKRKIVGGLGTTVPDIADMYDWSAYLLFQRM